MPGHVIRRSPTESRATAATAASAAIARYRGGPARHPAGRCCAGHTVCRQPDGRAAEPLAEADLPGATFTVPAAGPGSRPHLGDDSDSESEESESEESAQATITDDVPPRTPGHCGPACRRRRHCARAQTRTHCGAASRRRRRLGSRHGT